MTMPRMLLPVPALLLLLAACSDTSTLQPGDLHKQDVTLPGGQVIHAEVVTDARDMERGLMFRQSLAPDAGMLFVYGQPGAYKYWMYQTLIPLDIIWMDSNRRIVEISANTPPCKVARDDCPTYGGNEPAQYVLELGGGAAARYGLKNGDTLRL